MTRHLPAYIAPSSVDLGNIVTVTTQRGDVKESATAEVARIVKTAGGVTFISPEGNAFGSFRYGSNVRVLLVAHKGSYEPETLFSELDERIA